MSKTYMGRLEAKWGPKLSPTVHVYNAAASIRQRYSPSVQLVATFTVTTISLFLSGFCFAASVQDEGSGKMIYRARWVTIFWVLQVWSLWIQGDRYTTWAGWRAGTQLLLTILRTALLGKTFTILVHVDILVELVYLFDRAQGFINRWFNFRHRPGDEHANHTVFTKALLWVSDILVYYVFGLLVLGWLMYREYYAWHYFPLSIGPEIKDRRDIQAYRWLFSGSVVIRLFLAGGSLLMDMYCAIEGVMDGSLSLIDNMPGCRLVITSSRILHNVFDIALITYLGLGPLDETTGLHFLAIIGSLFCGWLFTTIIGAKPSPALNHEESQKPESKTGGN